MIPDLSTVNEYHALRARGDWDVASVNVKTASLYRAYDYITATYRVDGLEGTTLVQRAIMVLAPVMLDAPADVKAGEQAVLSTEERYGQDAIVEKKTYAAPSDDPYPLITAMLASFGKRGGRGAGLARLRLARD